MEFKGFEKPAEFKGFEMKPAAKQTQDLITPEEVAKIHEFYRLKKEIEAIDARVKAVLLENMKKEDIKKVDNDIFTATYVAGSFKTSVDTEKLKADGLYEKYTKRTPSSGYVRLKFKEA